MRISPEIAVTPDCPTVRIREPRERVDLAAELPRILSMQGWGIGTVFHVAFVSHDRTMLLALGRFVVTEERENIETSEANPFQPISKAVVKRAYAQLGEWWERESANRLAPPLDLSVRWNPGKQAHEVVDPAGEVVRSFGKDDGGKAAAEAFAAGQKAAA